MIIGNPKAVAECGESTRAYDRVAAGDSSSSRDDVQLDFRENRVIRPTRLMRQRGEVSSQGFLRRSHLDASFEKLEILQAFVRHSQEKSSFSSFGTPGRAGNQCSDCWEISLDKTQVWSGASFADVNACVRAGERLA